MMTMEDGTLQDIDVTVTFLEMHVPPPYSPPVPYNRQIALLKTKEIPLPAMIKVLMIMSVQVLIALVCIFRIA
jgi:hypothetical protein